jgi:MFS family permease
VTKPVDFAPSGDQMSYGGTRLGLRANLPQFVLFSVLTLWIGWFLGMERVVVPVLASDYFHVSSFVLVMSFIASFGFTKAILNMFAGRWSDGVGRRPVLILGWLLGIPVPFILIFAPDWSWVVAVNILMGFNQALTWTMTVTSKIDLVGPSNRGLALGINEFAGYVGQASGGVISGLLAAYYGLRPYPFYFGLAVVLLGLAFSFLLARETKGHAQLEARMNNNPSDRKSFFGIFATTTWRDRTLFSCSQAGLVEKFTDTLVWALYPLFLVAERVSVLDVALIVGVYQLVWGGLSTFHWRPVGPHRKEAAHRIRNVVDVGRDIARSSRRLGPILLSFQRCNGVRDGSRVPGVAGGCCLRGPPRR